MTQTENVKVDQDRMHAVVNHGPGDYRLENQDVPAIDEDEVLLGVDAAGICGSDVKCYTGSAMFWDGDHPWVQAPVTPGHEYFGTVHAIGERAARRLGLSVGDKAIAEQIYPCEECRYCRTGHYWMCEVHDIYGFQKGVTNGAWAEYMKLGARARVHHVPSDIPVDAGVLIEPLACAIHAVERGDIQLGDIVVLAGAGTLGLLMLQSIKLKNPQRIVVLDTRSDRLAVAADIGADLTIDVSKDDPVSIIKDLTGGYGCDVYIEASGYPDAAVTGLEAIRKLGTMVVFGVFGSDVTVDWSIIGDRKELDLRGAHLGPHRYPLAIDYLSRGVVKPDGIVTHKLPLTQFEAGLELVKTGGGIKVALLPQPV